jgi:hypothetical protein
MSRPTNSWTAPHTWSKALPDGRLTDAFIIAILISVPLTVAARTLLPIRFESDSDTIAQIAQGAYFPLEDLSYYRVGLLYRSLGMADRAWLASALGMALAAWALWGALRQARGRLTVPAAALIGIYTVLVSVYLSQYSKDIWVLPVIAIALFAPAGVLGELAVVAVICGYAAYFRSYWYLILVIYLALRAVTRLRPTGQRVIAVVVVVIGLATLLAPLVLHQNMQEFREAVNLAREDLPSTATMITPPHVGAGPLADSLENLLTLAALIVPLPLAALGSPLYLIYTLVIMFVWGLFGRVAFVGRPHVFDGSQREHDDRVLRWSLLVVAFVTTQGFYEPDYGSFLRHLTPILPLILAVVLRAAGTPFLRPLDHGGGHVGSVVHRRNGASHVGRHP